MAIRLRFGSEILLAWWFSVRWRIPQLKYLGIARLWPDQQAQGCAGAGLIWLLGVNTYGYLDSLRSQCR
jgi:hypothetical protein